MFNIGDKVGLLDTGNDYTDTFAGQEVEVIEIAHDGIGVRTYNGICLFVQASELAPALPKKRGGRERVKRADDEQMISMTISLPESDVAYLATLNPRNRSDAIRKAIRDSRDMTDIREEYDHRF